VRRPGKSHHSGLVIGGQRRLSAMKGKTVTFKNGFPDTVNSVASLVSVFVINRINVGIHLWPMQKLL
jgi:hypothetical protein